MPASATDISLLFGIAADLAVRLIDADDAEVRRALDALAALRAGRKVQVIGSELVVLVVDYDQSLSDLVAAGPVSQNATINLTDEHFSHPAELSGKVEVTFEIPDPFGRFASDIDVRDMRSAAGLIPMDAWQTIALGRARPDLIVVGDLNAAWVDQDDVRCVPVVYQGAVDLYLLGDGWRGHLVFPGVRASKALGS